MLRRNVLRAFCNARERLDFDLIIVGGGPAGLSCALRAKQIDPALSVCLVEKGSEIGSHILSGNVFEPRALTELVPDWKEKATPVRVPVLKDEFFVFPNKSSRIPIPHILFPKELDNSGNYVISLGEFCKWLAGEAENAGIEIYPGFSISDPIYDANDRVVGVRTIDTGISKEGKHKMSYSPGMDLFAKHVVLAEGARGSITEKVIERFNLRAKSCPPTYSLGLKEVWEVAPEKHNIGHVSHGVGFPLDFSTYGGSFLYHMDENLVHLGLVIGLDYSNAYLNTYSSFQKLKTHDSIKELLSGGRCLSFGARVLSVGGFQALPKLSFPGGVIVGCSAGFLNLPKIKGTHTAMKSGMIAAEILTESIRNGNTEKDPIEYESAVRSSWIGEELHRVRNVKPAFKLGGLVGGLTFTGTFYSLFKGREPFTLQWSARDCDATLPVSKSKVIEYAKPDGKLTFDLLDNLVRTGVKHDHDQPSHLKIKPEKQVQAENSFPVFGGPESRFCPANVYEYPEGSSKNGVQINAQNCIHCKSCSIKTSDEFIEWTVPEGGGGPQYTNM